MPSATDSIIIPAPADASGNTIGAQRFDMPLTSGVEYDFSLLSASDPGVSALLFLFDASGQIIPFSDAAGQMTWIVAQSTMGKRFTAPAGVAGFAVQVQSPYNASAQSSVVPSLTAGGTTSTALSVVTTSDDGGYFLSGDGTRQWIDNACLAELQAAGVTVQAVAWDEISGLTQQEGVGSCAAVIAALTSQESPLPEAPAPALPAPLPPAPVPPAPETPAPVPQGPETPAPVQPSPGMELPQT